jgi:hypothetical protein
MGPIQSIEISTATVFMDMEAGSFRRGLFGELFPPFRGTSTEWQVNMSSEPKLNVDLKILKLAGHQIGDAHIPPSQDGRTMRVWIDAVPCTLEDVLKMVEEEIKESEQPG